MDQSTFSATVQKLDSGAIDSEAAIRLRDLIRECIATGKRGSISLTLTVLPDKQGSATVHLTPEIKVTPPKPPMPPSTQYLMRGNGDLIAIAEYQMRLPYDAQAAPVLVQTQPQAAPDGEFTPVEVSQ